MILLSRTLSFKCISKNIILFSWCIFKNIALVVLKKANLSEVVLVVLAQDVWLTTSI